MASEERTFARPPKSIYRTLFANPEQLNIKYSSQQTALFAK